ncbi:MAG: hypothetical protein AAGC74_03575 [Verrucomicrobiota bacterium]
MELKPQTLTEGGLETKEMAVGIEQPVEKSELPLAEEVRKLTLDVLVQSETVQAHEKDAFENYLISTEADVGTILPLMAELRKVEEDDRAETIEQWGRKMSIAMRRRYSLVPFAPRLLNPNSFYDKFDRIYAWAKELRVPVLYAEDADSLGLGTINPAASEVLAERIRGFIEEKVGSKPFVSSVLIDLNSWKLVCRKHFEL